MSSYFLCKATVMRYNKILCLIMENAVSPACDRLFCELKNQ